MELEVTDVKSVYNNVKLEFDPLEWEAQVNHRGNTDSSNWSKLQEHAELSSSMVFEEDSKPEGPSATVEPIKVAFEIINKEADEDRRSIKRKKGKRQSNECDICGKVLKNSNSLREHRGTHNPTYPFECSICFRNFRLKKSWLRHRIVHIEEKPFSCETCGQTFKRRSGMLQHCRLRHAAENYKNSVECEYCNEKLASRRALILHRQRMHTHTGGRPYSCSVCTERFSLKGDLAVHQRTHEEEEPDSSEEDMDVDSFNVKIKMDIAASEQDTVEVKSEHGQPI